MDNETGAKILEFKRKKATANPNSRLVQQEPFHRYYVPLTALVHYTAAKHGLQDGIVQSILESEFGIDHIGKLPVASYDSALQFLIDLEPTAVDGRKMSSEDRKVINDINHMIYDAWVLWRNYFHRTPQEAAELMMKAIKDHEEYDQRDIMGSMVNDNA